MWSYTDARYQPPPPYIPRVEPYEPFALAAVELEAEGLVVLGQVADGYGVDDLTVGAPVELVVEPLYTDDDGRDPHDLALEARGRGHGRRGGRPMSHDVAIAGVGMHPWGKWGRPFQTYGVHAARAALADAGLDWSDVQLVVGGETVRNGYAGYVAGATFAQALGWNGARVATAYAACATGAQALDTARARILAGMCDVALVVGADTTPKGFLAPNAGERYDDPDWLRFRLLGMTNPAYFALYARRRMDLYGATPEDFAAVKVKNARHGLANPNARYRKEVAPRRGAGLAGGGRPAAPARHLRHLRRRRRRGAHLGASSPAGGACPPCGCGRWRRWRRPSPTRSSRCPTSPPTRRRRWRPRTLTFRDSIAHAAYEEAGLGPRTCRWPRSTTCRPPSSSTGTRTSACASRARPSSWSATATPRSAAACRSTPRAGWPASARPCPPRRWPRCARSPGSCRGQAEGRQVEGARVGITANQGLFGHGCSVIVSV